MGNDWGRYQEDADAANEYGRHEMGIVGARDQRMRERHPGAKGWASPPFIPQPGSVVPVSPWRLVDEQWTTSGCIAVQAQGLRNVFTTGATHVNVTMRAMRQGALITRSARVQSWGMAFPFSAGQIQVDLQVGAGPIAGFPAQTVIIFASLSVGVPVPESYPDDDVVIGLAPVLLTPPDFARTLTLTCMSGGPLVGPIPLAPGQSTTISAFARTLTGPPGTHLSVTWGVLSP